MSGLPATDIEEASFYLSGLPKITASKVILVISAILFVLEFNAVHGRLPHQNDLRTSLGDGVRLGRPANALGLLKAEL